MRVSLPGRAGIEMSGHALFVPRIRRLAGVSSIALGIIWVLAITTTRSHAAAIDGGLLLGWILMPTVLRISIRHPEVRPMVSLPSALVTVGLLTLCLTALPADAAVSAGWLLITGGILFGDVLGGWFWFRWFPVPPFLDAPFGPARWVLVGAHVAMITAGIALVAVSHYIV